MDGARISRGTSRGRRSSTSSATCRPRPGPAAAIRCLRRRGSHSPQAPPASAPSTFVVAYGSLGGAERLWWLLRHFGHDACAVLSLDAWQGPLRGGEEQIAPATFTPRERRDDTIGADELAARAAELVVVDARVPARWRGEPNPTDRVPGRIPGALNTPWNEPLPALPAGDLVAYCGSGVTACVPLHRLQLAGRDGRLYPGSWSEWEQRPDLPRASGDGAPRRPRRSSRSHTERGSASSDPGS